MIPILNAWQTFKEKFVSLIPTVCVSDPLSEISRMVELPRLYKNVYNKPFQLPSELNKEKVELDAEAIKVEISLLLPCHIWMIFFFFLLSYSI